MTVAITTKAPRVRLAVGPDLAVMRLTFVEATYETLPSFLLSYAYISKVGPITQHMRGKYDSWVLDSGAFSVYKLGKTIDLHAYTDYCQRMLAEDDTCTEVFSLDIIGGDWRAGVKNAEYMWSQGVPAIPCYHAGEPWEVIDYYKNAFPGKIAISSSTITGHQPKLIAARKAFARVWPMRIHGFALSGEKSVAALPWHSVDSSTWILRPRKFGLWDSHGRQQLSVRGAYSLQPVVELYLKWERRAQQVWRREMQRLERECAPWPLRTV